MGLLDKLMGGYAQLGAGYERAYNRLMEPLVRQRGQEEGQRSLESYRALLANPDIGVGGAGVLAGLLGSQDADARAQGRALVDQYLQGRTPEAIMGRETGAIQQRRALLGEQGDVLANTATAQGITQAGIMGPLQVESTQAGIANTQANTAATRWRLGQDQAAAAQPSSGGQLDRQIWEQQNGAPVPSGYRPVRRFAPGPDGGPVQFIDLMPIENTEGFRKAESELRLRESMYTNIQDFLDGLAQVGTEYRGEAAYKLSEQRRRILGDYAQLLQLGVLQPSEMTNLENILPDPTSFGNQLNPFAAENIAGVYSQLGDQYAKGLKDARDRNWFIPYKPVLPEDASGR